jgi:hypothetical protein
MPLGNLSERDRLRLAELIRAPLVPPLVPQKFSEKQTNLEGPARAQNTSNAGWEKLRARWDAWSMPAWSTPAWFTLLAAHWKEWAGGAAVAFVCLLVVAVSVKLASRPYTRSIQLHALDRQGQLQIRWDPDSDPIRRATNAKLFITDGVERLFVDLNTGLLRRGVVSYARESDLVNLRLALTEPDGRLVEQRATFFGEPPPDADRSRLETSAKPELPVVPAASMAADPVKPVVVTEHRSRRKPVVESGRDLPFTCAAGDIFRKTDAAPGWDTFTCRGKNVWSVSTTQLGEDGSANRSGPATLTAKPAHASTTL